MIRVLLADDHALIRTGLATLIRCARDMTVVGEAEDGRSAVEQCRSLKPDVVVMDLMMPVMDGATATEAIVRDMPSIQVLVLTSFGSSEDLIRARAAGARGVLLKDTPNREILAAIRTVASGKEVLPPALQRLVEAEPSETELSERQLLVLNSVTKGFNTDDIARQMGISPSGVKKHLGRIFARLGACTRAEAVAIALRRRLVKT